MFQRWLFSTVLSLSVPVLACPACEDAPKPEGPQPPDPLGDLPDDIEPILGDGHLLVAQRGVPVDEEDFAVISDRPEDPNPPRVGVSVDRLTEAFGLLVLNLPYVSLRLRDSSRGCVPSDRAPEARVAVLADDIVQRLDEEKGLRMAGLAVNVDLLSPGRTELLSECFAIGAKVRFGEPQHRENLKRAFRDLAVLPGLRYITVGQDMNRYFHLVDGEGLSVQDDYANFITLYREIYIAIKEVNPDVKVGPGLSWDFLMNNTTAQVSGELGLSSAARLAGFYRAWQRTVRPLLVSKTNGGALAADFVGFSILPETTAEPFEDVPSPVDPDHLKAVRAYFRYLPLAGNVDGRQLDIAITQTDWRVRSAETGASKKGPYLKTLKSAVSHTPLAFMAWRRLSDLPTDTEGQTPACDQFTIPEDTFHYKPDYCIGGMLDGDGRQRDIIDILTQAP